MIDEHGVIHVQGTRVSDKTTLTIPLESCLMGRQRVVDIPSWRVGNISAESFLIQECHKSGYTQVQAHQDNDIS